ncbi:hypothetical protein MIR68_002525 [Amoeboaphelidium protococcarum]|nr:hypothetical protein MIR68_002525 [Amoeboaphelidium protococcarum]
MSGHQLQQWRQSCLACQNIPGVGIATLWPCLFGIDLKQKREQYRQTKNELNDKLSNDSDANAIDDPLSDDISSKWNMQHQHDQLRETILLDVTRTFPDFNFFRLDSTHQLMVEILFTWCILRYSNNDKDISGNSNVNRVIDKDFGYRQGMHEILAPILFHLDLEQRVAGEDDEALDLEADGYVLFDQLMQSLCQLYNYHNNCKTSQVNSQFSTRNNNNALKGDIEVEHLPFQNSKNGGGISKQRTLLLETCDRIQNQYLRLLDPELYQVIVQNQIEPSIYMIRWLKLLFGREVSFELIPILWSALIADNCSNLLSLSEWICISLILLNRDALIQFRDDQIMVMQILMKSKEVLDVELLVQNALMYRDQYQSLDKTKVKSIDYQPAAERRKPVQQQQEQSQGRTDVWQSTQDLLQKAVRKTLVEPLLLGGSRNTVPGKATLSDGHASAAIERLQLQPSPPIDARTTTHNLRVIDPVILQDSCEQLRSSIVAVEQIVQDIRIDKDKEQIIADLESHCALLKSLLRTLSTEGDNDSFNEGVSHQNGNVGSSMPFKTTVSSPNNGLKKQNGGIYPSSIEDITREVNNRNSNSPAKSRLFNLL